VRASSCNVATSVFIEICHVITSRDPDSATHTHTHIHTHTHHITSRDTDSPHTNSLSLSLSLTHTHTNKHTHTSRDPDSATYRDVGEEVEVSVERLAFAVHALPDLALFRLYGLWFMV